MRHYFYVPFRDFPDFKSQTLRDMTTAYDGAVAILKLAKDDPRTSKLAIEIVALVKAGERDPSQLRDLAVAKLQKQPSPS